MSQLLWTLPVLPLAGFLILALAGRSLGKRPAAVIGAGSVSLSALVAIGIAIEFLKSPPPGHAFTQTLWTWIDAGGLRAEIAFRLDPLSLVMMLVITCVGALIHIYSTEYMQDDAGFARFFARMNLFVASMLILVLADDLLLLYLGWEGVGLCSYLLIGFWYEDPANGRAARKAFVVTRIGDTAMAVGLFLLVRELGTLHMPELFARAEAQWAVGSTLAVTVALLLLGGAVGKSAQLPLQTWLPDAMAGPTPVSALIHAATMVTAGVYLVARTHPLFQLAPDALLVVAIVGAATLLVAGLSALAQRDIKRILAYSTISQLGYMFLGLGVGAWSAAVFHLMTHAFFKALLFLAAGAVIVALHHEQDVFAMGGLRKELPGTYLVFLAGAAALAGFPLVTAGFYSKDAILAAAWASERGGTWLWAAGLLGAFVTALYAFRLIFIVFWGDVRTHVHHPPGKRMMVPLMVLAVLSLIGGFLETPATLGHVTLFSHVLEEALPAEAGHLSHGTEAMLQIAASVASLAGIGLAWLLFAKPRERSERFPGMTAGLERFLLAGWDFDRLYDVLVVRPFVNLARISRADVFDRIYSGIAALAVAGHRAVRSTQTGRVRWYAAALALGTVLVLALVGLR